MKGSELPYGLLNSHSTGIVLKTIVERSVRIAAEMADSFVAEEKVGYDGVKKDIVTDADKKIQSLQNRWMSENFPSLPLIGEENSNQNVHGSKLWLVSDPIDGTKAYSRLQSDGVGSMVALVSEAENGQREVLSAYVGNVNTGEIFGYRPESNKVHRIKRGGKSTLLSRRANQPLYQGYVLLRDPLQSKKYGSPRLVEDSISAFSGLNIIGSSIGVWFTRLWTQEVQALIMPPGIETPWDSSPVIGISKKLGYVFYKPASDGLSWEQYMPEIPKEKYTRDHDTLVIHSDHHATLMDYA
jgi:fructose-1,6-bisphosphatase/inositol monophosphatase family enzyme